MDFQKSDINDNPLGIEISLVTDDVKSYHQKSIENGAKEIGSPIEKPWSQLVSYLKCPTGILIELCTLIGK